MKEATFDPAKECKFYFRCNRAGSKDFVVLYSTGTPYSFIYQEFAANIYRYEGEKKVFIPLILAYNSNVLTVSITKELSNVDQGEYYFELYNVNTEQTWIATMCEFHNGRFDGVSSVTETLTVNTEGEVIEITIQSPSYSLSVSTQTTTATLTPDGSYDAFSLTAQTTALTIANPSTDYANFDGFMIRVYTAGAQTLTFGNKYRAQGEAFPATTTAGKVMIITAIRDSATDKYDTRFSEEV